MARLQMFKNESGFSLIELTLALAISSSLAAIAFVGQGELRNRARFDAAVDRAVSTIASAHTASVAGVNVDGDGNGAIGCPGGTAPSSSKQYVFAGTSWTVDGSVSPATVRVDYYKALPGSGASNDACIFNTETITMPALIQLSGSARVTSILFVRTNTGALSVCPVPSSASWTAFQNTVKPYYRAGGCPNAALSFSLNDGLGHSADMQIDASGLARRLN